MQHMHCMLEFRKEFDLRSAIDGKNQVTGIDRSQTRDIK